MGARDGAFSDHFRENLRQSGGARAFWGVKALDGSIRIPDRNAFGGEHGGGGGFAHADRAGQPEAVGFHSESTALRVASSTSGR